MLECDLTKQKGFYVAAIPSTYPQQRFIKLCYSILLNFRHSVLLTPFKHYIFYSSK